MRSFCLSSAGRGLLLLCLLFLTAARGQSQDCGEGPAFTAGTATGITALGVDTVQTDERFSYIREQVVLDGDRALLVIYDEVQEDYVVQLRERSAAGAWAAVDTLRRAYEPGSIYGWNVALSGDYAFVSDPQVDNADGERGRVYMYRRSANGNWPEVAVLENTYTGGFLQLEVDRFGDRIAASDNYLVVAGRVNSQQYVHNSFGFVYRLEGDTWIFDGELDLVEDAQSLFLDPASISVDGDRIAIADDGFPESAYVFERNTEGAWRETASFDIPISTLDEEQNVALKGDRLLFGSGAFISNGIPFESAVYVYEVQNDGGWELTATLQPDDRSNAFGEYVALTADYAIVSDEDADGDRGKAYVFGIGADGNWREVATFSPLNPRAERTYPQGYYTYGSLAADDNAIVWISDYETKSEEDEDEVYMSAAFFYDLTPTYTLPAQTLAACAAPAYRPETSSDCAVTITANADLTAAGTYHLTWTALDAAGNRALATQQLTVTESTVALPLTEDFTDPATPACWTADPAWSIADGAYRLTPGSGETADNQLALPGLALGAGQTYLLSFRYRSLNPNGGGRLVLSDQDGTLFDDATAPADTQYVEVLLTPAEDTTYALRFSAPRDAADQGLLLDDVSVMAYTPPTTDGASRLEGAGDAACTRVPAPGLSGNAWRRILSANGKLLAEINPDGNDLGNTEVSMTDYAAAPTAPFTAAAQLGRYFSITPANGSGPYSQNGGVKVRLYVTDDELAQLEDASGEALTWSDLVVTHYSGANDDCDLLNSTGGTLTTEDVTMSGDYGGSAHYVEFVTQTFSEFGVTYQDAVSVTPGWAQSFPGLEAFPNPTSGRLTLQLHSPVAGPVRVNVTDVLGRVVLTQHLNAGAGPQRWSLPLDRVPAGTYLLTVTDGIRAGTLRVVRR